MKTLPPPRHAGHSLHRSILNPLACCLLALLLLEKPAPAATYYADPVSGSMSNPGTATQPWSTLQAVFGSSRTFAPGDVILLRSGNHGSVYASTAKSISGGSASVRPDGNHIPFLQSLNVLASNWGFSGLIVTSDLDGNHKRKLVQLTGENLRFENSLVYGPSTIQNWTPTNWWQIMGTSENVGITCNGNNGIVTGNVVRNILGGINIGGANALAADNLVEEIGLDGMHVHGDDSTLENNMIREFYIADDRTSALHRDGIQAYKQPAGTGTLARVVIRGNTILNTRRHDRSGVVTTQGIGMFDGFFDSVVIENNLVSASNYQGISINGAQNCKILSNTVMPCPIRPGNIPWIRIGRDSTGNLIRNNLTADFNNHTNYDLGTVDFNVESRDYDLLFTGYRDQDYRLSGGSAAIGKGTTASVPATDIDLHSRVAPYDAGCHEYLASAANPAFSLRGGMFLGPQKVTLSSPTSGATIRYTLDGTRPTATHGTVYTMPLAINTPTLVKAVAYMSGMAPSEVAMEAFAIVPITVSPLTSYYNEALPADRAASFTLEFDATPGAAPIDGLVTLSAQKVTHYTQMAAMVRFNPSGKIDARNGGAFSAATQISYSAGTTYHFRVAVDPVAKRYSVFVRLPDSTAEQTVGINYAFRSEQSGIGSIGFVNALVWPSLGGSLRVANIKATP